MSFLEYRLKTVPVGFRKVLHLNWALILLIIAVSSVGFLMLYSVAGGRIELWAEPQMKRFGLGMFLMFAMALVPIWLWRNMAGLFYVVSILLLLVVEFFGTVGMGAQRWIDLGFMRLQPSELMKVSLVVMLAAYYDWLDLKLTSRPLYVLIPVLMIIVPTLLVFIQPNHSLAVPLLVLAVMITIGIVIWQRRRGRTD